MRRNRVIWRGFNASKTPERSWVPEAPESGAVYVFDRRNGVFYLVDFNDQKWGGYSLAEYEVLERTHRLTMLAQRPWLLDRRYDRRIAS
jgi:hypothetical protein